MQILSVSDIYFPQVDPVSVSLRVWMREMQAKGHAVTLIAPEYPDVVDTPGDDIIRVSSYGLPFGKSGRAMKIHRALELTDRLRSWSYDIIHVHTSFVAHWIGTVLGRRLGLPVVETWNAFYEEDLQAFGRYLPPAALRASARWLTRLQCHALNGVIVHSVTMRDRLQDYGIRRPVTVIPNGIETHLFQSGDGNQFHRMHGIASDRPLLICIGRFDSLAPFQFLLRSLRELQRVMPDILLVLAGEGTAQSSVRSQMEDFGLRGNVLFIGALHHAHQLLDALSAAHCFVFAGETEGVLPHQAMAAALPVVTTVSARSRGLLAPDSPAVITEETVSDFSAQIFKVLNEAQWRRELGLAGKEYVQRWSASVTVEQVIDCYQETLALQGQPERALAR